MLRLILRARSFFIIPRYFIPSLLLLLILYLGSFDHASAQSVDPAQVDQEYLAAIKKGDQYYTEEKYDRSLYEFETARKLKPNEKYPQERIKGIKEILDDQKTKNVLFEVAVTSAEKWFKAADYKRAKAEFENALRIDPSAQYPKDRLAQINKIWSDPEVDAAYAAAIIRADDLFAEKRYRDAKEEYIKASDLKPYEQYPLDRIIQINEILAKLQLLQDQYDGLIARADEQFNNKAYAIAKPIYQDASNIKPDEAYPKNRIKEIEDILAKLQAERDAYDRILALADQYYMDKDFDKARVEYQKAAEMKPSDLYPMNMIAKIDPLIAQMQVIQQEYDLTVANANTLLQKKDYEGAIALFQKAGDIKPMESLPKDKIAEIKSIMNELADHQEKEQRYTIAITRADSLFTAQNLEQAKSIYQQALGIYPDQPYPAEKITDIETLLTEQKIQKEYDSVIASADKDFANKNYSSALENYGKALTFKPAEAYPQTKIDEINTLLSSLKAFEDSYAQYIQEGDRYFTSREYKNARTAFLNASTIKPAETYPKTKIAEIDKLLADMLRTQKEYDAAISNADLYFNSKDYTKALTEYQKAQNLKPDETYPPERIAVINQILQEIQSVETAYDAHISSGDDLLRKKDYQNAMTEYQQALTLKPSEVYPKSKITEIEIILAGIAANDQAYQQAISAGDAFFTEKDYLSAIIEYQKAQRIKPNELYPQEKIGQINQIQAEIKATEEDYQNAILEGDKLLASKKYDEATSAYLRAKELKPSENYPDEKINEINIIVDRIKKDEDYQQAIAQGDALADEKKYEQSIASYQKALDIKPGEKMPQERINIVQAILADILAKQKAYADAISKADGLLNTKEYEKAKQAYQEALTLDPGQAYPQDQIEWIDEILRNLQLQRTFDETIAKADQFFTAKDYDNARTAYQNAINLKPDESYPQNKINEINSIMAANEQARQESYNKAIGMGDSFLAQQDYKNAKVQYQNAISINPGQQYPKDKLKQVEDILMAREIELKQAYQQAIAKADNLYTQKILDEAIDAYMTAYEIKNDEVYPMNMINQIKKYIEDHAIVDILNSSVIITSNTEHKFDFAPVDIRMRKNNYIVMKARVLSEAKPKVYLNYGRDAQRSGGIVLKSIKDNEMNDYIIRVSAQDPWYRNDNNWLKLYSEGGDIEVTYIQISTAE